jgi:hypothetical protein
MSTQAIPADGRISTATGALASQTNRIGGIHLASAYSLRTPLGLDSGRNGCGCLHCWFWNTGAVDGFGHDVVDLGHQRRI